MPINEQLKQPQSIFPDLPRASPAVDKNGNFTQLWDLGLSSLFQALQDNFKNEGILFPRLDATQIAAILALYTPFIGLPLPQDAIPRTQDFLPDISGQTVFDTTNRVPKQFIITFNATTPPNPPTVATVAWKTFTLT